MSRSYWLSLCGAVGFALACSTYGHCEAVNHGSRTAQKPAKVQTQSPSNASPSIPSAVQNDIHSIASALKTANTDNEAPDKASDYQRYLNSQTDLARWGYIMLFIGGFEAAITALGVFLVWRTLLAAQASARQAKRAADAAEQSVVETRSVGQAQVRAYLTCLDSKFAIMESVGLIYCWPAFKNTGRSPARNVWVSGVLSVLGEKSFYRSDTQRSIVSNIPAEMDGNGLLMFSEIGREYMQRLRDGQTFSIDGEVYWEDVFGVGSTWAFTLMQLAGSELDVTEGIAARLEGKMRAINREPLPREIYEGDDDTRKDGEPHVSQTD